MPIIPTVNEESACPKVEQVMYKGWSPAPVFNLPDRNPHLFVRSSAHLKNMVNRRQLSVIASIVAVAGAQCPDYLDYAEVPHGPYSSGRYNLSYQRPEPACRTFNSSVVEDAITRVKGDIVRKYISQHP
jgi:hypothetical protein